MDELEARIEALERAVTDGDHDLSALAADGEASERLVTVERELGELTDRVAELEAATQALRGYVGNVRAINRDVEQRADTALAKAESLESSVTGGTSHSGPDGGPGDAAGDGNSTGSGPSRANDSRGTTAAPETAAMNGTGANETVSNRATGTDPVDHPEEGHQRGRCRTCGRPTTGDGHGTDSREHRGPKPEDSPDGPADDTLDRILDTDGPSGDDGTFERIRKML